MPSLPSMTPLRPHRDTGTPEVSSQPCRAGLWIALAAIVTAPAGCAEEAAGGARGGTDAGFPLWPTPGRWEAVTGEDDPFDGTVAAARPCGSADYEVEPDLFEVQTDACNYVTLVQASQCDLVAGQAVNLAIWHNSLGDQSETMGQIVVMVAGEVITTIDVAIPSPATNHTMDWSAGRDIAQGTPVYFHMNNHGSNSYRIGDWHLR